MSPPKDHVCVCICTYKRPAMLGRLLETLRDQKTDGLFTYSAVVVDNDAAGSARPVVERARRESSFPVRYETEPEQNISLARNRALRASDGAFLAGIDDDEYAEEAWLLTLYKAVGTFACDGVLGPVRPAFELKPPRWATKGGVFERKAFPTGTKLNNPHDMRCGNFFLAGKIVRDNDELFDPRFGKTGGEDVDFFRRMLSRGYDFVWCQEAAVYESVPPGRLTRSYLLKRALLRGVVSARLAPLVSFNTLKSLAALVLYSAALPFLFVFRNRLFMPLLIKNCDHAGKVLARFGIRPLKQRSTLDSPVREQS